MLAFSDVKAFLAEGLSAAGYDPVPQIQPGPDSVAALQKLGPEEIIFVMVGGGSGLTTEQLYDVVLLHVRVIGPQGDFTGAEKLALDIDKVMLAVSSNARIGQTPVLFITRAGGRPQELDADDAERTHFTCDYVTEAATGL